MPFSATRDLWLVIKARDEATRALRGFSRDIRLVGDSVRMANLQASKSALVNQMAVQRLTGATQAQLLTTQRAIQQNDRQIAGMKIARAAAEEHRVSMQRLSSSMMGVSSAAGTAGLALTALGFFGTRAMTRMIDVSIEYGKQAALTRTQVEGFVNSQREIEDVGLRIARTIPAVFEQIQPALFDIFSSMDVGIKDAEKLLREFSKASVAGQTDITKAGRSTIGILNAFQLPLSKVNHLLDLQFQLVQEGLGTYEEWAGRIGLVTPSAVRFGQTVEMMTAALAAATRMGIPAARAATAVSRAMDAMSHPNAVKGMKALGINALDASGNFRPMIDIMGEFREKLMKMPKAERIKKILDVFKGAGGTIEARRFLQNMLLTPGNLELFKTIFTEMSTQSGSFEKAYAMMADTTAAKSQLLSNQWMTLKVMAGEALAPAFLRVVAALSKVVEWFNNLDPRTKSFITTALAVTLVLMTVGGILALLVGGVAAFVAAFAVAGSSLLVVLGGLTLLSAGFAGLVAAIVIAWNRSEGFRSAVKNLGQDIKTLWQTYIVPTGLAIKKAWDENMKPALNALAAVIKEKVMPIFQSLSGFMRGEFISRFKEVGNFIKEGLVVAFEQIGKAIKNFVIPAINAATRFYNENKKTIDSLVITAIILATWIVKIGLALLVLINAPVVVFIIGVIAAFVGFIALIIKIIGWLGNFVGWLTVNVPKAWAFLVNLFMTGMAFLANLWSKFWNSDIMQFVRSIFNLIISIVNLSLTIIFKIFQITLFGLYKFWRFIWDAVYGFVRPIWDRIFGFLKGIWDSIVSVATGIWRRVREAIGKPLEDARKDVMGVFDKIRKFFADAGSWLFNAGKELIGGLIRGITEKAKELTNKIREITQKVKDFWPFSPAKTGPLSGTGSPFHAGQNIARMLAKGLQSGMRGVTAASTIMAAGTSPRAVGPLGAAGRTINQSITINTTEINPRRQAAELGWALSGRM